MLRAHAFDYGKVAMKHQDDPVTDLDKMVEKSIRLAVLDIMPANFIGEEYGIEDNGAEYTWIIDPIDGTKSLIRGEFNCALSIAVEYGDQLIGGCVNDFMRDIIYFGYGGKRSIYHQGIEAKLRPRKERGLRVLVEGEESMKTLYAKNFQELKNVKYVEMTGSIALSMAKLAFGAYDAIIIDSRGKGNPWDVAAGHYLISIDGLVRDFEGKPISHKECQNGIYAMTMAGVINLLYAQDELK
jgi:fructose-1,6-bisphosphatase/inositol monophosphatase family enzyme